MNKEIGQGVSWYRNETNARKLQCMTCKNINETGHRIEVKTKLINKTFWYCVECYKKIKYTDELPTLIFDWMNIKSLKDISLICYNCKNPFNLAYYSKELKVNDIECDLCKKKGTFRVKIRTDTDNNDKKKTGKRKDVCESRT